MAATRQNPPSATNAERVQSNSAADLKLALSVSQPRRTERFDSRRVRARRLIVRELDEILGVFKYPDVNVIYAVAPSREAVRDD
jgi:hypothetical protein